MFISERELEEKRRQRQEEWEKWYLISVKINKFSTVTMSPNLDTGLCNQLAEHVEILTTSGKDELDPEILKKLKKICRLSDDYIKHVYHLLIHQLEEDHAEVRLSSLQICDELFRRSHQFRELLVSEFQTFLELTVEIDPDQPLPPPAATANKLKTKALEYIRKWHQSYGEGYTKLKLGYNFLKECKKIDFDNIYAQGVLERRREEEKLKRIEIVNQDRLHKCIQEMEETIPEINSCMHQICECLKLLSPDSLNLFSREDFAEPQPCCSKSLAIESGTSREVINSELGDNETLEQCSGECIPNSEEESRRNSESEDELVKEDDWMRQHGIGSIKYNLTVEIKPESLQLKVTSDNIPLVNSLKEFQNCLSQKHAQKIAKWIQALVKGSGSPEKLKHLIDLKNKVALVLKKCKEVGIDNSKISTVSNEMDVEDDDDDEEFEEVESKEGFEPIIPQHRRHEYGLELQSSTLCKNSLLTNKDWTPSQSKSFEEEMQDPTSCALNFKRLEEKCIKKGILTVSSSGKKSETTTKDEQITGTTKAKLLNKAPKLRFDTDLLNWGEEMQASSSSSRILKTESLHRFWQPIHSDILETVQPEETAALRTRVIEFSGKFEQVKWECRAPLKNGKLCPRQDRHKCPFHGPIIPRDNTGVPSNEEDKKRLQKQQDDKQRENPEWQDPKFLKELESATGVNLTVSKRKNGKHSNAKKKRKYPGLTDLNAKKSTTRTRLEKIVFDKSSVKRVSQTLDHLDYKKFTDKFANQFNYSYIT